MSRLQLVVGAVVSAVWVIGYLMAFFVDRSLQSLASSVTPVMLVIVGALFTSSTVQLLRGGGGNGKGGDGGK